MDWGDPEATARLGEHLGGVLRTFVRVEDDAGDVAAAHRGRRLQRRGGEVELALVGGDLRQVPTPLLVDAAGRKVALQQVWNGFGRLVGPREGSPAPLGARHEALGGHEAATVFSDTRQPSSRRSVATLGDLYVPPESSKERFTA